MQTGADTSAKPPDELPPEQADDRRARARQGLLAFLAYLSVSFALYAIPVLTRFSRAFVGEGRADAKLYVWALSWWPHAVATGLDPFSPKVVWAPSGVNMAWVTGLPGPALVLWPVTVLFGAVVSSNVSSVLAPAAAAWAAYLLCRRAASRFAPAFAGGYLFGFSTYLIAQMQGHLNLFLVFPVPLAVYLVVRWFDGSLGQRRFVTLLGLTLVAEFSISTEVFTSMTFFGVVALGGLWLLEPALRGRTAAAAGRVAIAYAAAGVVLSPYLYYAAIGVPAGPLRPVLSGSSSVDLLSYLLPRPTTLIGGAVLRHVTAAFQPDLSEDGAYLSPALIVALASAWWTRGREDRAARLSLAFAGVAGLLSLGSFLHVDGHRTVPMPWAVLAHVPVLQDALPQRFTMYAWIGIAVAIARWLADAGGRWRWWAAGAAAALLLPNVFAPGLHGAAAAPAFFSRGLYRHYLHPGQTIVVVHPEKGQEMLWQAQAGFAFSIAQGYTGPEPESFRHDPFFRSLRDGRPQDLFPSDVRNFVTSHGVTAVVVDDRVARAWREVLVEGLLVDPVRVGGVELYRPRAGQTSF